MIVVVVGLSGLTNAYRSVPSTWGSAATSGASRWLDALPGAGPRPVTTPAPSAAVAARAIPALRNLLPSVRKRSTSLQWVHRRWSSPPRPRAAPPRPALSPSSLGQRLHALVRCARANGSLGASAGRDLTRKD